jgi:ribulose-5-phosphate 4-epimerase/fuculose-1-phosphate aldolase
MNADRDSSADEIQALRIDLAAAFRLAVQFGWHESVGNHFSAAVSADGKRFLLNPRWKHFATIRASDLLLLDADDADVMHRPGAPDASAWALHGALHSTHPAARVLLHCHPTHATALATLKDPMLKPIDNNTARFFNRVGLDAGFGGIADNAAEGARVAGALGSHQTLMMGNHGIICTGQTVAEAFEDLYFFEKAAQTLLLAYASGQPIAVLSDEVAENTARGWDAYRGMAQEHFDYLKAGLDRTDPSYRD